MSVAKIKLCEICGQEFERNPRFSQAQWQERRFCGRSCSAKFIASKRKKTIGACASCGDQARLIKSECQSCYAKRNYRENREKRLEVRRAWREKNPDYWKQERFREAARLRAKEHRYGSVELYRQVLNRDDHQCTNCCRREPEIKLAVHHIDGVVANNYLENLVTLCFACHARLHIDQGDYVMSRQSKARVSMVRRNERSYQR